ncbi:MAG: response regulator transcription factor [Candidatus Dormibacteraeota bacterium]|nr:response regulator transcription factor [Candidatus Dormibacteraeota bacterium]
MRALRAIVADEEVLFAEVLSEALNLLPIVNVIARTADGLRLLELVREHQPDVVIMDIQLPRVHGVEVIRTIRRDARGTKILVIAISRSAEQLVECIEAGVDAYLTKTTTSVHEVNRALQAVARGETYIAPLSLQEGLRPRIDAKRRLREAVADVDPLTSREREILHWLARGLSTKDIAQHSGISHSAVRNHISSMYQKLRVPTRTALVLYAVRAGLLDQHLSGVEPQTS